LRRGDFWVAFLLMRVRLPDAIIWATAQVHGLLLVTRNVRDFPQGEPGVSVPYRAVSVLP